MSFWEALTAVKLVGFISSPSSPEVRKCPIFPQLSRFSLSCEMSISSELEWRWTHGLSKQIRAFSLWSGLFMQDGAARADACIRTLGKWRVAWIWCSLDQHVHFYECGLQDCEWVVSSVPFDPPGDRIVKVNGESIIGKTYSQVIALIQNR